MERIEGVLRYPVSHMLGSVANVRTLRELARHGGELSAPSLTRRTGLSKGAVRQSLLGLDALKIVEAIGSHRSRLYRMRRDHPLSAVLRALFQDEDARFDAIVAAVRAAAERCGKSVVAAWIYGSVARDEDRPGSDLDVAVVADAADVPGVQSRIGDALRDAEDRLAFSVSVVAVAADAIRQLAKQRDGWWLEVCKDAISVVGDAPDVLFARLKHRNHARHRAAS
jgi:predicted nucleotidyltransferase